MKPIENYPDYYITEDGQVISHKGKKPRALKAGKINNGCQNYLTVTLRKDNKSHNKLVHRLVAEAFIPNPQDKPQVNHKDKNAMNNKVDNLEWVTPQENSSHGAGKWWDLENVKTGETVQIYNLAEWSRENNEWAESLITGYTTRKGWRIC